MEKKWEEFPDQWAKDLERLKNNPPPKEVRDVVCKELSNLIEMWKAEDEETAKKRNN